MEATAPKHRWRSRLLNTALVLMPVWFPYVYTGAILLQMKLTDNGPLGMRGLYFLVFIVAAIAIRPIFKGAESSFGTMVFTFLFYLFALAAGYMTAWIVTIQAFGP